MTEQRLNEIPFEEIQPGLRVIGAMGTAGTISGKHPRDRYPSLDIEWDNGNTSERAFHHLLCHVMVGTR